MRRVQVLCPQPAASLLLALALWSGACFAGLTEGLAAFDRGDFKTAQAELQPLAAKGDVSAEYTLGIASYNALGTPQDYAVALKWFSRAAAQGLAPAQYCLAVMYAHGQGVREDPAIAIGWYKRAAMQGNAAAFHNLAVQFGSGRGVTQDMAAALAYFMLSADQGIKDDEYKRDMLVLNLKPQQIESAKAMARQLKAGIKHAKLPPLPQLGDLSEAK
jgi:TPR repeat protein